MNEAFPPGRHSRNRAFNADFEKEERICGYEHCIEGMPFSDLGIDCPVFGHDCPGGSSQVETCRKTKGRLRSIPLLKGTRFQPQVPPFSPEESPEKVPEKERLSLEKVVASHFPPGSHQSVWWPFPVPAQALARGVGEALVLAHLAFDLLFLTCKQPFFPSDV